MGKSMVYSVGAWLAAIGIYLMVRFLGTNDTIDWAPDTQALVILWLAAGGTLGIVFGISTIVSESSRLRRKSYGYLISFRVVTILIGALLVIFLSRLSVVFLGNSPIEDLIPSFVARVMHPAALTFLLYIAVVSALLGFVRQMVTMVGERVLVNLILGRYHQPKDENRIFMFLDLKSSTTHAERLGHTRFFRLIQDCFHDLTDSAKRYKVEIYQYVGDEAILTWTLEVGKANANCVKVYFDFQKALNDKAAYYEAEYGLVPEFKAGVNLGPVTVAEVGDIKRDIAYLSDVLNTAARIQDQCNEYGQPLLISKDVKEFLPEDPTLAYHLIGNITLRGKSEVVDIFSVQELA